MSPEEAARKIGQGELFGRREIRQLGLFDPVKHSAMHAVECPEDEPCVVQQQFAQEVDVNTIVKRFAGGPPPVARLDGVYGDFTGVTDFESALERVEAARRSFMSLDPEVRERYGNDPGRFVAAAQGIDDPEKLEALVRPRHAAPVVPEGSPPAVSPSGGDSGGPAAGSAGGSGPGSGSGEGSSGGN